MFEWVLPSKRMCASAIWSAFTTVIPVKRESAIVMFLAAPRMFALGIVSFSIRRFIAPSRSSAIRARAPGFGRIVTIPGFAAPRNVP